MMEDKNLLSFSAHYLQCAHALRKYQKQEILLVRARDDEQKVKVTEPHFEQNSYFYHRTIQVHQQTSSVRL